MTWQPPSRPIRVGLVGLGNVGLGFHLPALLAMPDLVTVVAVADPSAERRDTAIERSGIDPQAAVASAVDLVRRDDVDLVDLATPPHVRTALALDAIRRGRALLCEKPLATVPADAASVVAAAGAAGVPVAVVHNYLEFPELRVALEAIRAGRIGAVEVAILNYLGVEDRPGNAAWRPDWRHDATLAGGGVLMDMLHVVYVAEALLGSRVRRVSAQVLARSAPASVEDVALCRLEADRAAALVNVGWGAGPGGIVVSGDAGRIEIAYAGGGTSPFAPLVAIRLVDRNGGVTDLTPPPPRHPSGLDVHVVETFRRTFEAIADGGAVPASAADGLRVLETTLAAYASAATGRSVDLPLAPDDPVHQRGIAGLRDLPLAPGGAIALQGVFGVAPEGG